MKHIIFVWIPVVLFALFLLIAAFVSYPVPFSGAIVLLGASISGYSGVKAFGVYQTAKALPSGAGVSGETKKKLTHILIALYVIIAEALVVQYFKPALQLPLDDLFIMAGICSAVVLGGTQAIKGAEQINGKDVKLDGM